MEITVHKVLKTVIVVVVVCLAIPVVVAVFTTTTKSADAALAEGLVRWEPVSGAIIERKLADGLWEQEIVDWHGRGLRKRLNITPTSMETKDEDVWVELDYSYSSADRRNRLRFSVATDDDVRYESEQAVRSLMKVAGPKVIPIEGGQLFLQEGARIRLRSPLRSGFKRVPADTDLVWRDGKWTTQPSAEDQPARSQLLATLPADPGVSPVKIEDAYSGSPADLEVYRSADSVTLIAEHVSADLFSNDELAGLLAARAAEPLGEVVSTVEDAVADGASVHLAYNLKCGSKDPDRPPGYITLTFHATRVYDAGQTPTEVDYHRLQDRRALERYE